MMRAVTPEWRKAFLKRRQSKPLLSQPCATSTTSGRSCPARCARGQRERREERGHRHEDQREPGSGDNARHAARQRTRLRGGVPWIVTASSLPGHHRAGHSCSANVLSHPGGLAASFTSSSPTVARRWRSLGACRRRFQKPARDAIPRRLHRTARGPIADARHLPAGARTSSSDPAELHVAVLPATGFRPELGTRGAGRPLRIRRARGRAQSRPDSQRPSQGGRRAPRRPGRRGRDHRSGAPA